MNLILLFKDDFVSGGDRVCLRGRRHKYVRDIHRATVGDELCVGLCGDRIGTGKITQLDDHMLEMDISLKCDVPKPLLVTLVLALPRPLMCKRILASVSAMGVKRIILFHANRVEKSFWKSPVLQEKTIKEQLILGLEQARDTIMPDVELRPLFKPFVEDELPNIVKGTRGLVAHPEAVDPCPREIKEPVTLAIGPEGGFVPYEIDQLKSLGFLPVHIGERILRVESAIPALLSRLF